MKVSILEKFEMLGTMSNYATLLTDNYTDIITIKKDILIFGACHIGIQAKYILEGMVSSKVSAFVDNDMEKIGRSMVGLSVLSPEIIRQNPSKYFIIIAANTSNNKPHPSVCEIIHTLLLNYGCNPRDLAYFIISSSADFSLTSIPSFREIYNSCLNETFFDVALSDLDLPRFIAWFLSSEGWIRICEWIYNSCLNNKKILRILEIGSGIGLMSIAIKKIIESDINITWLNLDSVEEDARIVKNSELLARKKYGINTMHGNVETVSCNVFDEYGKFDIVILTEVLEHFNYNPVPTLMKIKRWVSPNGMIFISTPSGKAGKGIRYYDSFKDMPIYEDCDQCPPLRFDYYHSFEYSYEECLDLFTCTGLFVKKFDYCVNGGGFNFCLQVFE